MNKKQKHPRDLDIHRENPSMRMSGTKIGRLLGKFFGYDKDLVRSIRIFEEARKGFDILDSIDENPVATFFGSNRNGLDPRMYEQATKLASLLTNDNFSVITGGGRGIMEAANKGAFESKGNSIGFNIELDSKQHENDYITDGMLFHYFFIRKFMLSFSAEAYIFFPGGFGTMDEFFEIITLIQTNKIKKPVAVIVFGKQYWSPLLRFIDETLYQQNKAISEEDQKIYNLFDDADQAYQYITQFIQDHPYQPEN